MSKKNEATTTPVVEAPVALVDPILEALKAIPTVSGQIRFLHAQGLKRGTIAKMLGKRYQHVRNVLIAPLKKTAE